MNFHPPRAPSPTRHGKKLWDVTFSKLQVQNENRNLFILVHHEADSWVLKVSREYHSVLMLKCHYCRGASSRADGANLGLFCSCVSHSFVKQPKEEGGVRSIFLIFLLVVQVPAPNTKSRVACCRASRSTHPSVWLINCVFHVLGQWPLTVSFSLKPLAIRVSN